MVPVPVGQIGIPRAWQTVGPACLAQCCLLADRRLRERFRESPQLSPTDVAREVAACLPAHLGAWLLGRLEALGWLSAAARIPCDALDSPACPPEFRGPWRELVRLAVFGLPGQGRPDYKHREATYQMLCAQIVREASDLTKLSMVATRALSHPDVCRDPVLAAMVRSFVAEREAALRAARKVEHPEDTGDPSQLHRPFLHDASVEFPTRPQILRAFLSLEKEFEVHLAEYNEAAARYALEKMEDLAQRFPVHIKPEVVRRHRDEFDRFIEKCDLYRRQIEDVARQAAEAACHGDTKSASWLLRRLRAIHALTPALLSAERFEALRREIEECGAQHEHREALRDLIDRERQVADRIKRIGAAIYRFHRVAQSLPPDSERYRRAEAAYRDAVREVRELDTEWLTGLLLELETYLEDLHDPAGRAQQQLDRFIGTVRNALTQLRREIRAIQAERGGDVGDEAGV